ncbi:MAG: NAD(P)H-binding protein [Thermoleophilaceae bacterium]|nr:NAD(P)H-binding protein [Thermoleophilaceae bacterium]
MELVTGATGYVGRHLIERLSRAGRPVRALARDPTRVEERPGVEPAQGDLVSGEGLEDALQGCSTAYYLVHSMGADTDDFASRDRRAARNFTRAARAAGLERAVYLGGLVPAGGPRSVHLRSRLEVEQILLDGLPRSTALRASILIGAESSSFRILVRLVERLRILPFPAWRVHRTRPIAERDAVEYLALTPERPDTEGRSLDIAGPDAVSYGQMIERIADLLGVGRLPLPLKINQTPAASALVAAVTDQPRGLVRPLMESLEHDLLPRDDAAAAIYGLRPLGFGRAVERALADWERTEELAAR